jgi:hypothetical protein
MSVTKITGIATALEATMPEKPSASLALPQPLRVHLDQL